MDHTDQSGDPSLPCVRGIVSRYQLPQTRSSKRKAVLYIKILKILKSVVDWILPAELYELPIDKACWYVTNSCTIYTPVALEHAN
jgi:hypothetical protein